MCMYILDFGCQLISIIPAFVAACCTLHACYMWSMWEDVSLEECDQAAEMEKPPHRELYTASYSSNKKGERPRLSQSFNAFQSYFKGHAACFAIGSHTQIKEVYRVSGKDNTKGGCVRGRQPF